MVSAAIVFAVAFAVYAGALDNDFINYDDPVYVTNNKQVIGGLTLEGLKWAFTTFEGSLWAPLTWISHMADVHLFEMRAWGHHLTSVLLHALNSALVFVFFFRTTGERGRSLAVALLWAVHPLGVESVAWVAERKNVLSGCFALVALVLYAGYVQSGSKRKYWESVLAFALSLMAKPMVVVMPCLLLLVDIWPLNRFEIRSAAEWRSRVAEKIPFFVLTLGSSIITVISEGEAVASMSSLPLWLRLQNSLVSYALYLRRLFWPDDLAILYPFPHGGFPWSTLLVSAAVLVAVTVLALRNWDRNRACAIGWFWYLGVMVPVIGIVQVGVHANADRFTYFGLIGLIAAIVFCLPATRWTGVAMGTAVLAFSAATIVQLSYWENTVKVFTRALAVTENNYLAHVNLGVAVQEKGHTAEAMRHFQAALATRHNAIRGFTLLKIANLKAGQQDFTGAEQDLNTALSMPMNTKTRAMTHAALGFVTEKNGKPAESERHLREAIRLRPQDAMPSRIALAVVLNKQHRYKEAAEEIRELLKENADASTWFLLGQAEENSGNVAAAREAYEKALALEPNFIQVRQRLEKLPKN